MEHAADQLTRILKYIWSIFINGLLTILPITLTLALFNVSIKLIISWFKPLHAFVDKTPIGHIPYIEIFLVFVGILALGAILKIFILRAIFHTFEKIISRIPLVRLVYSGIKQLVHAFGFHDAISFKRVVFIEFPRKGIYSLGFLTSEVPKEIAPTQDESYFNVFIPTTPNPTSGFFMLLAASQISFVDLTRQEAMAMIISGGIIQPERLLKQKGSSQNH